MNRLYRDKIEEMKESILSHSENRIVSIGSILASGEGGIIFDCVFRMENGQEVPKLLKVIIGPDPQFPIEHQVAKFAIQNEDFRVKLENILPKFYYASYYHVPLQMRDKFSGYNIPGIMHGYWIVMQKLDGDLLGDVINQLSQEDKVKVIKKLARKVKELWDVNVAHGDLHLWNILFLKNNRGQYTGDIRILDVGWGRVDESRPTTVNNLKNSTNAKYRNWLYLTGHRHKSNFSRNPFGVNVPANGINMYKTQGYVHVHGFSNANQQEIYEILGIAFNKANSGYVRTRQRASSRNLSNMIKLMGE